MPVHHSDNNRETSRSQIRRICDNALIPLTRSASAAGSTLCGFLSIREEALHIQSGAGVNGSDHGRSTQFAI